MRQETEERVHYKLAWEYIDPRKPGVWQATARTGAGEDIKDQATTLKRWAETGEEPIRNVTFERISSQRWGIHVCPRCGQQSRAAWCCSGCRVDDPQSPSGTMALSCDFIEVAPAAEADHYKAELQRAVKQIRADVLGIYDA